MGGSLGRGMTLVMSIWDDHDVNMLWLDSTYPTDSTAPMSKRGPCAITSGKPSDVEANSPDAHVKFSKIRTGEIDSTYPAGPSPPTPTGDKFKCESGACVASATGVSKELCTANCESDAKYTCKDNTCTKSTTGSGLDLPTCQAMCGNAFGYL
jgi:cellulose 1,4-beta-cellobiosidase